MQSIRRRNSHGSAGGLTMRWASGHCIRNGSVDVRPFSQIVISSNKLGTARRQDVIDINGRRLVLAAIRIHKS